MERKHILSTLEFCLEYSISRRWPVSVRKRKFRKEVTEKEELATNLPHAPKGTTEGTGGWKLVTDWVTLASAVLSCNPCRDRI